MTSPGVTRACSLTGIRSAWGNVLLGPDGPRVIDKDPYALSVAFSPDSARLALSVESGRSHELQMWDWRARRQLWSAGDIGELDNLVFAPDGTTLTGVGDTQRLIDAATGRPVGKPYGQSVLGALYARDGGAVATIDGRGWIARWDLASRRAVGEVAKAGEINPLAAAYSPHEDVVAVTDQNRVRLYDLASGVELGRTRGVHRATLRLVAFSPDGSSLVTADAYGVVHEQPVAPAAITDAVCARVGRSFTEAEWQRNLPDMPYREICER